MSKNKRKRMTAEYRKQATPQQFEKFLEGGGLTSNRQEVADYFDYDWHSRKLKFETRFRGHILM